MHLYMLTIYLNLQEVEDKVNEEKPTLISTSEVEKLMLYIRGMEVLLDRDVAMLYGVETRDINKQQSKFERMLGMKYFCPGLGEVQLMVGVRKRDKQNPYLFSEIPQHPA